MRCMCGEGAMICVHLNLIPWEWKTAITWPKKIYFEVNQFFVVVVVAAAMQYMTMWASVCENISIVWQKSNVMFKWSIGWLNRLVELVFRYINILFGECMAGFSNAVNQLCLKHCEVDISSIDCGGHSGDAFFRPPVRSYVVLVERLENFTKLPTSWKCAFIVFLLFHCWMFAPDSWSYRAAHSFYFKILHFRIHIFFRFVLSPVLLFNEFSPNAKKKYGKSTLQLAHMAHNLPKKARWKENSQKTVDTWFGV